MEKRQLLHMTLYCSSISPCGKYLAVGNNYGFISVFNISNALSAGAHENNRKAVCIFKAQPGAVHALHTVSHFLVSAGYGPIIGWKWADLISNKPSKVWTLNKDVGTMYNNQNEMYNCLSCSTKDELLYAGGNDATVTLWDLKTGTATESFVGHNAYIHDINVGTSGLVSGSEDGCVKVSYFF